MKYPKIIDDNGPLKIVQKRHIDRWNMRLYGMIEEGKAELSETQWHNDDLWDRVSKCVGEKR